MKVWLALILFSGQPAMLVDAFTTEIACRTYIAALYQPQYQPRYQVACLRLEADE